MVRHPVEVQQALDAYAKTSSLSGEELANAIQREWGTITQHCRGAVPEAKLLLYRYDQLIIAYHTVVDAATGVINSNHTL